MLLDIRGKRFCTYVSKAAVVLMDCGTKPGPSSALFWEE